MLMNIKKSVSVVVISITALAAVILLSAQSTSSAVDVFFEEHLGEVIRVKTTGKGEFQGVLYRATDEVI